MKIIDTKNIYEIGMISTLFNINPSHKIREGVIVNTAVLNNNLTVITSLNLDPLDAKTDEFGLYPLHISLLLGEEKIGGYDTLATIANEVVENIMDGSIGFEKRLECLAKNQPNFVEYMQNYLRYQKKITPKVSLELDSQQKSYNYHLEMVTLLLNTGRMINSQAKKEDQLTHSS